MSGWQPIETAPQDGSWLLVFDPKGVEDAALDPTYDPAGHEIWTMLHVFMAHWNGKEWIACFGEIDTYGCPSGGYDSWVAGLIVNPTDWQPLPAPPR